jgi:hypothetical protein
MSFNQLVKFASHFGNITLISFTLNSDFRYKYLSSADVWLDCRQPKAGIPTHKEKLMRQKFMIKLYLALSLSFLLFHTCAAVASARQQAPPASKSGGDDRVERSSAAPAVEERLRAMEQIIERQQREIQALREMVTKRHAESADGRATQASQAPAARSNEIAAANQTPASGKNEAAPLADAQKKVDELYKRFGSIRLSGDIRFRAETFHNQGFDSPAEAPGRTRLRVRARLAVDGSLGKNFDWGLRLASGIFTDPISTNQTLTDFFERKPFALERAFVRYDSKTDRLGVQLVAGKFEPTFRRTQMVWDDDVNVEGASEAFYFKTDSSLRQIKLVAFQLPFDEQAGGKDGVLYGGQAQTDWQMTSTVSANFNLAYYNWNRADRVVRGLGASAFQVNGGLTNGAGVTGGQNGALGTTNRLIRDANGTPIGLLANFNLFDILGTLTWQARPRLPVAFTFDYVRNLSGRIDDERNGYWASVQVGQAREKRDWLVGYTYTRIEQDAVLVPFNFSDILASNSRAHIPVFAYQVADGVTLQWTGLFSRRANKILPQSAFNRWLNRMQFDVIYRL